MSKKISEMEDVKVEAKVEDVQLEQQTLTLSVNLNELNIILQSLQELPHRIVDPLLKKLIQQAQSQVRQ